MSTNAPNPVRDTNTGDVRELANSVAQCGSEQAAEILSERRDEEVAYTLEAGNPSQAVSILWDLPEERRAAVLSKASPHWARQWAVNHAYPEKSVGRLMSPAFAEFPPSMTVRDAIEQLRAAVA